LTPQSYLRLHHGASQYGQMAVDVIEWSTNMFHGKYGQFRRKIMNKYCFSPEFSSYDGEMCSAHFSGEKIDKL
jgi:hypothetical protein